MDEEFATERRRAVVAERMLEELGFGWEQAMMATAGLKVDGEPMCSVWY